MNRPSFAWRPTTSIYLLIGLVLILVAIVSSYVINNFRPTVSVTMQSNIFRLWVADDEAERQQGLSGVEELKADGGMLFKYDGDGLWGIWMKDMLVPLDIVWINSNKEVVYIVKQASPDLGMATTFTPKDPARYVVELPAGSVVKSGIKVGQTVDFNEKATGSWW